MDDLVGLAKSQARDNSPEMNEIVRRFRRAAYKIAANVVGDRHDLLDDVANAAMYAVVTAVRKHNGATGCVHYINEYMRGAAHRVFSLEVKRPMMVPLDSPVAQEVTATLVMPVEVVGWGDGEVGDVVASLPDRHRALLWSRYGLDLTLKDIAVSKNVTVSAISQQLTMVHQMVARLVA